MGQGPCRSPSRKKALMITSPEIAALILEWYRRIASGDAVRAAQDVLSAEQGFLAIGTDPGEWIEGREAMIRAYNEMARAGPPEIAVSRIEAYSEGAVGWVADVVVMRRPGGHQVPMRHTFVLHKEDGEWKAVHAHYSFGLAEANLAPEF